MCNAQANMMLMSAAIDDSSKDDKIEAQNKSLEQLRQQGVQDAIDSRLKIIAVAGDNQDTTTLSVVATAKEELVALQAEQVAIQQERQNRQDAEIRAWQNRQAQMEAFNKQSDIELRKLNDFFVFIAKAFLLMGLIASTICYLFIRNKSVSIEQ
jgi:hypothetical protein